MLDSIATFSGVWGLFGVLQHLNVHLVGAVRPGGSVRHIAKRDSYIRLSNSESRISNQIIAAKLRTVVTLNCIVFVH